MANHQMPHNLDAEAAILGCILIDGDVQTDVLESLSERDFYQENHREILSAMKAVYASRKPVDVVTLTDRLDRDGKLERVGGVAYLTELSQAVPSAANFRDYVSILKRDSVNRSLIRAAKDIIENSTQSPEEADALSFAEKMVYDISQAEDGSNLLSLEDGSAVQAVLGKFEAIQSDPNAFRGLATGFKHLDRVTHGLQKGSLVIIAARPGVGKTSLAMNIVEHACLQKQNVAAVFSLEMPRLEIVQRLLCCSAEVSMESALSAKLAQKDWKRLMLASDKLQKSKIFIDDSSVISPQKMLSKCRRLKSREGRLDLVMVDYIQLMEGENVSRGGDFNRQQEVASITRALKIMAKELDVPVIALSQLRRIQTKEAQLSDLRESGAIEQDADIVMFINRLDDRPGPDGTTVKGAMELNIAKHRNGATEKIQLRFIGDRTKFIDVEDLGLETEPPEKKKKNDDFGDNPSADEAFDVPFD